MFEFLKPKTNSIISIENGKFIDKTSTGLKTKQEQSRIKNAIISGLNCPGKTNLIDYILTDAINNNNPIIYIRNRVNNNYQSKIAYEIEKAYQEKSSFGGTKVLVTDIDKCINNLNVFRGFSRDKIIDYIIDMMDLYIKCDDNMKDFTNLFLNKVFDVLALEKKEKFNLNDLAEYNSYYLQNKYDILLSCGIINQVKYKILLDELHQICGMYQTQIMKYNLFAKKFVLNNTPKILSGNISVSQIYLNKAIFLANLNLSNEDKNSNTFLKYFLKRLIVEETKNINSATIIFEDIDLKQYPQELLELLKIVGAKNNNGSVYFTENNLSYWNQNKDKMLDNPANYCNCFFVFKQNNKEDIKYYSSLSGAIKKIETTQNKRPLSTVYRLEPHSFTSILFGNKMVNSGYSQREVDSFNVEEKDIDGLDSLSCIVIMKFDQYIYNKIVSW